VLVAECDGEVAGYTTLLPYAKAGPYAEKNISEISDFNVLMKFQRRGIGSRILDAAERAAAKDCDAVSLGVGLHAGYGAAQRLYVKRGYIPDGSGVWYKDQPLEPYTACVNDDDLVLYLLKKLDLHSS
jgi:GNAT superfamily N-acetyltransferase